MLLRWWLKENFRLELGSSHFQYLLIPRLTQSDQISSLLVFLDHLSLSPSLLVHPTINCSSIICSPESNRSSICPSDSHFVEDHTTVIPLSSLSTTNLTDLCCSRRGQCVCSSCPKTFCGEDSILQIYRTANRNQPGQCCDQFNCIKSRWDSWDGYPFIAWGMMFSPLFFRFQTMPSWEKDLQWKWNMVHRSLYYLYVSRGTGRLWNDSMSSLYSLWIHV